MLDKELYITGVDSVSVCYCLMMTVTVSQLYTVC